MLQVVAWGGMMIRYAPSDGMSEAARKTFDGRHKCSLCRAIDASRASENLPGKEPKAPAPEWSKFGKELTVLSEISVPGRFDGGVRWLPGVEPSWLWPVDRVPPPSPPPRSV